MSAPTDAPAPGALLAEGGLARMLGLARGDLAAGLDVARGRRDRGDLAGALRIYTALVLCDPREPAFQLGVADCAHAMGEHELCLHAASALIVLDPRSAVGHYLSGASCLALGRVREAREDLTEASRLAMAARDPSLHRHAERLLASVGHVDA